MRYAPAVHLSYIDAHPQTSLPSNGPCKCHPKKCWKRLLGPSDARTLWVEKTMPTFAGLEGGEIRQLDEHWPRSGPLPSTFIPATLNNHQTCEAEAKEMTVGRRKRLWDKHLERVCRWNTRPHSLAVGRRSDPVSKKATKMYSTGALANINTAPSFNYLFLLFVPCPLFACHIMLAHILTHKHITSLPSYNP